MTRHPAIVAAEMVAAAVAEAIPRLACCLPDDVRAGLDAAAKVEENPRGAAALAQLCRNADLAAAEALPVCQDTGTVRAVLEIGPDVCVSGDVFSKVDAAVSKAFTERGLRASVVRDALFDRANTADNTPAFCRLVCVDEPGAARLRIMLKGGGSDNACRVVMLPPSAKRAGVVKAVLDCVAEKAANACPPLTIGVGVGGAFDSVADLAAEGLWREIGTPAASAEAAALEVELLEAIKELGIGAGARGGAATALAVHVKTAPCHIAALPVAIEMGCCALRRCTIDLNAAANPEAADGAPSLAQRAPGEADESDGAGPAARWVRSLGTDGLFRSRTHSPRHPRPETASSPNTDGVRRLALPLSREVLAGLKAGESVLLSGEMYTLRDAGHARLVAEMDAAGTETLPYGLDGATIFYAGPTPPGAGRPFGAIGPTTASRMDAFAPRLYRAGIVATIGKGNRAAAVTEACARTGSVYFTAIGGAAAALASCVRSAETVAWPDLGTEALRRIVVEDFPVTVEIDAHGSVFSPAETQEGEV